MSIKTYMKQETGMMDWHFLPEEFDSSLCGYIMSRHALVNKHPAYSYRLYGKYVAGLPDLTPQQKMSKLAEFYAHYSIGAFGKVFPLVVEKEEDDVLQFQKKHPKIQLIPPMGDIDMNKFIVGIGYLEHTPYAIVYDSAGVKSHGYSLYRGGDPLDISDSNPEIARHSPWLLVSCK